MKYFVFGLQRSGTNFIETILQRNFGGNRANRANRCWKHSIDKPAGYDPSVYTVIIYKNPYTWAESLCFRNTVDWAKSQKTYPVTEVTTPEFQAGSRKYNISNLAKTYKHWCDTWIMNPPTKHIIIKYEDLLVQDTRSEILNRMAKDFVLKKNSGWYIPDRGKVSQSNDYTEDREKYYLKMKPSKLSAIQTNVITDIITPDMLNTLGYTPEYINNTRQ